MTEVNPHTKTWITIINPNAGTKKAERDWHNIAQLLRKHEVSFAEVFTLERGMQWS